MFIIFGDKHRTEPVEGGISEVRPCPECGEQTLFVERVVSKQFRVYFVEMFTHGTHHVLECTRCKTAFVTDELAAKKAEDDHGGTVYGRFQEAMNKGREAAMHKGREMMGDDRVAEALEQAEGHVNNAMQAGKQVLGGLLGKLRGEPSDGSK